MGCFTVNSQLCPPSLRTRYGGQAGVANHATRKNYLAHNVACRYQEIYRIQKSMITFKHFVQDDVQDDTLNLEIWKGEDFEIAVKVFLDDRVDIDLLNPDQTYSSSELVEILKIVVPFAIETASVHDSVRKMDEERRRAREEQ